MTEQRDRDGRDSELALQVAVPLEKMPQTKGRVVPVTHSARASAPELHRALYDMMVAMVPALNENTERTDATYLKVIDLSRAFNDLSKRVTDTRAKVGSSHDLADASQKVDDAVERVAEVAERLDDLAEEIHTDHGVNLSAGGRAHVSDVHRRATDSDRVRVAVKTLSVEDKADKWDRAQKRREKIVVGTVIGVLTVVVLAGLGIMWRVAKAYDDGAAAEHARTPVKIVEVPALPIPVTAETPPMLAAPPASAATVAPRRHP